MQMTYELLFITFEYRTTRLLFTVLSFFPNHTFTLIFFAECCRCIVKHFCARGDNVCDGKNNEMDLVWWLVPMFTSASARKGRNKILLTYFYGYLV